MELGVLRRDHQPETPQVYGKFYCPVTDGQRACTELGRDLLEALRGSVPTAQAAGTPIQVGHPRTRLRRTPRHVARRSPPGRGRPGPAGAAVTPGASSVEMPTRGRFRRGRSACAVAIPMRRPVKVPGPTPTPIRSSSAHSMPACPRACSISSRSRLVCPGRAPGGDHRATPPPASARSRGRRSPPRPRRWPGVAVSKARILNRTPRAQIPTAWLGRTWWSIRPKATISDSAPSGHSTKVIVPGPV